MNAMIETKQPGRAAVLSRVQSVGLVREHALVLTSAAVGGLLRVAATRESRCKREVLVRGSGNERMSAEDVLVLLERGYFEQTGPWIKVTDLGNALVREVVSFCSGWKGVAA